MPTKLETKTAEITEKRNRLAGMFDTAKSAGDGLAFTAAQVDEVKTLNTELNALGREVAELRTLDEIETKNRAELDALNTPVRQLPFSGRMRPDGSIETKGGDGGAANDGQYGYARPDLGTRFIESKAFKAWQHGQPIHVSMPDIEVKTLFQTSAGWAPFIPRIARIALSPQQLPRIIDVFPTGTTGAAAIKYMQETLYTNNAAGALEAGTYAESAYQLTEQTQLVVKLTNSLPVTDEQLDDVEGARDYINNRMELSQGQLLDNQLLTGSGVGANLLGIANVVGIQTAAQIAGDDALDSWLKSITAVQTVGFSEPSAILANPIDWQNVRLLKTTQGQYIWGHPSVVGPATAWGLPVVTSTFVPAGESFTGDYRGQTQIFFRKGLEFMVTNSHQDDFTHGRQMIRCDQRCVLVVYRPKAIFKTTGIT